MPHRLHLILALCGATAVAVAVGQTQPQATLLGEVTSILEREYVNPLGLNLERLKTDLQDAIASCPAPCNTDAAERAIAAGLERTNDPHLRLIPSRSLETDPPGDIGDRAHGARYGIRTRTVGATLFVTTVQSGSNAEARGVQFADRIERAGATSGSVQQLETTIARAERDGKEIAVTLRGANGSRRVVTLAPTNAAWNVTYEPRADGIAVIRVPSMDAANKDAEALHAAVNRAVTERVRGIVLDLRETQGGTPYAATNAVGAFIPKATTILENRARMRLTYSFERGSIRLERSDQPGKVETDRLEPTALWTGALVVLVSAQTFSAGENIALTLQRLKRVRVIGEVTRGGAGVGANIVRLSSGAQLFVATLLRLDENGARLPTRVTPDAVQAPSLEALSRGNDAVLETAVSSLAASSR
jgi:C-terminal processing protease CtpA/Prc